MKLLENKLRKGRRWITNEIERRFVDPQRLLMAQAALSTRRGAQRQYRDLWDLELKVFSQFGEDGILDFLCDELNLAKPRVLEVGAGDFSECNSRFLAEIRGASVFAVDSAPGLMDGIRRGPLAWRTSLWGRQTWVTPDNIGDLVREARDLMCQVDVFSLDVDGNDYWILEKAPLEDVSIVVVEYNPLFGASRAISVPQNDNFDRTKAHFSWLYYGASLRAHIELLEAAGFTFVGTNRAGNNAFFVRADQAGQIHLELPDTSGSSDLSRYTDWRVREARDEHGRLSYKSASEARKLIQGLPMTNTRSLGSEVL